MHYSGILVRSRPTDLERCAARVEACTGVEVYLTDASSSSLIAVVETETVAQQEAALRAVQDLPGVVTADLVYHYLDEETETGSAATSQTEGARETAAENDTETEVPPCRH